MMKSWTWLIAEVQAERAAMFKVAPVWVQEWLDSAAREGKRSSLRGRDQRFYRDKTFIFSGMVERWRMCMGPRRRKSQPRARDFNRHSAFNESRTANSGAQWIPFCRGLMVFGAARGANDVLSFPPHPQNTGNRLQLSAISGCLYFATATAACAVA
jgi:hypothetical protein